jgi:hypothetical protein
MLDLIKDVLHEVVVCGKRLRYFVRDRRSQPRKKV